LIFAVITYTTAYTTFDRLYAVFILCNRWFRNGIHSLLSRADARESADIVYRM